MRTNASLVRSVLLAVIVAFGLAACTASYYVPNVIRLDPNGTATNPVSKSIESSFTLTAVEDGYTGQFTAETIVGECWVVQTPISTSGAWTVVPQGATCSKLDTEKIQVRDTNGHSAVTYIRSVQ